MALSAILSAYWPRFTADGALFRPSAESPFPTQPDLVQWKWLQGIASTAAPGIACAVLLPLAMIALAAGRYCCCCCSRVSCCAWFQCGLAWPSPATRCWRCGFHESTRAYTPCTKHVTRCAVFTAVAGVAGLAAASFGLGVTPLRQSVSSTNWDAPFVPLLTSSAVLAPAFELFAMEAALNAITPYLASLNVSGWHPTMAHYHDDPHPLTPSDLPQSSSSRVSAAVASMAPARLQQLQLLGPPSQVWLEGLAAVQLASIGNVPSAAAALPTGIAALADEATAWEVPMDALHSLLRVLRPPPPKTPFNGTIDADSDLTASSWGVCLTAACMQRASDCVANQPLSCLAGEGAPAPHPRHLAPRRHTHDAAQK